MTQIIKVLLADDHSVLRQGIAQVLESQEDMQVVAQAKNGQETIDLTRTHQPDIILMDINMPDLDGLEATKRIVEDFPTVGIIILTMYRRDEYVFKAIQAGAKGYLLKEVEMEELLMAVRKVAAGESVIDPTLTSRVFAKIRGDDDVGQIPLDIDLPERDLEILRYLARGLSNQEIAKNVFLTDKTVRNRLSLIFKKLNLKNRTEAALFALKVGLVDEEDK